MKYKDSVVMVLYVAFKAFLMSLDVNMAVKWGKLKQSVNYTEANKATKIQN